MGVESRESFWTFCVSSFLLAFYFGGVCIGLYRDS